MTADDFHRAFTAGWVAAGKSTQTAEYQLACLDAWNAYCRETETAHGVSES